MKTLVIGLGNPILTDDGVGVKVAYAVQKSLEVTGTSPNNGYGTLIVQKVPVTRSSMSPKLAWVVYG